VTINYRLGTLGFLALEDGITNGNYGLADQITALEWVQEHIRDFGGDPNRITIFGQSAGAASVRALLASPRAIGKYAAAIPQSNLAGSNYATTYSQYYTIPQEVAVIGNTILDATGCLNAPSQITCLRSLSPYTIANLSYAARFLVQDGTYLTNPELELTGSGPAAHVPVLMGFMRDDGAAFITYPSSNQTVSTFLTANGFNLSTITSLSILPEPSSPNSTLNIFNTTARIATDSEFRCLDEATAFSAVQHNVFESVYFYEFNRSYQLATYSPNYPVCQPPPTPSHPKGDPSQEYFKCHSGDLYYVFGTILFNGLPLRDDLDIPMSQFSVDTWAAFARTYDPNPDPKFLETRGFENTTKAIEESGTMWSPVRPGSYTLRLMEYPSSQQSFEIYGSQAECRAVGLGLEYYETH
jgi:carboxylesterase type B